jgi:hypothetical protein
VSSSSYRLVQSCLRSLFKNSSLYSIASPTPKRVQYNSIVLVKCQPVQSSIGKFSIIYRSLYPSLYSQLIIYSVLSYRSFQHRWSSDVYFRLVYGSIILHCVQWSTIYRLVSAIILVSYRLSLSRNHLRYSLVSYRLVLDARIKIDWY